MPADAGGIEERLLYEVRGSKTEDAFTGASAIDLVLLVHRAAQTMVAERRTSDADLDLASERLQTLLSEMEAARAELRLTEFHEITVSRAVANLCPGLWPFC